MVETPRQILATAISILIKHLGGTHLGGTIMIESIRKTSSIGGKIVGVNLKKANVTAKNCK